MQTKKRKSRKTSIPIQFDDYQVENLESVVEFEASTGYAELIRKSFDFYVKTFYPQLMPNSGEVNK